MAQTPSETSVATEPTEAGEPTEPSDPGDLGDLGDAIELARTRRVNGEVVASPPPPKRGKPPEDWSFIWKPNWILSHLFVLSCVVAFIFLGLWQLSRLNGREAINAMLRTRMAVAPAAIQKVIGPHESETIANHRAYRQVTVTGHYDNHNQILIQMEQDAEDDPGYWLVTPLILSDGTAVAINRGFVPLGLDESGPLLAYRPPSGTVTVTGMLYPTQNRTGGPYDPAKGHLHLLSRVDLIRYQRQLPYKLYPLYVNLVTSQPAQHGTYPEIVPPPPLDDGPHLNYAGQWAIFATLTLIVYPLLLRRVARNRMVTEADETVPVDAVAIRRPHPTPRGSASPAAAGMPTTADTRERILEAAVACIERCGLAKTSLDDVAVEAGVSRATVYRWFTGGRDAVISDAVAWEIQRFLTDLADAVEPEPDLEAKLVRGLVWGHRAIEQHLLLQRILSTEPELLLHELQSTIPVMTALVQAYVAELLARERLRPGVDVTEAATYVGGLFLSYLGSQGGWDLSDEDAVGRLVRTQLLAGVLG